MNARESGCVDSFEKVSIRLPVRPGSVKHEFDCVPANFHSGQAACQPDGQAHVVQGCKRTGQNRKLERAESRTVSGPFESLDPEIGLVAQPRASPFTHLHGAASLRFLLRTLCRISANPKRIFSAGKSMLPRSIPRVLDLVLARVRPWTVTEAPPSRFTMSLEVRRRQSFHYWRFLLWLRSWCPIKYRVDRHCVPAGCRARPDHRSRTLRPNIIGPRLQPTVGLRSQI